MTHRALRLALPFLFMALAVGAPSAARAQGSSNKAAAEALFEEGRHLMEQGKYAEACKKLEGSQKLDPGAGTLLNLASCYEKNGQTASAWVTYKDAATASADRHPDWAERANKKAAELGPNLSRVTIHVTKVVPGLSVKRDGDVVEPSAYDTALPTDPGGHDFVAEAQGYKPFRAHVEVGGSKDQQTVTVTELEVDPNASVSTTTGNGSSAGGTATQPSTPQESAGGTQRTLGLVGVGLGVAGIAAGSVFGLLAIGKKSDANDPSLCKADFSACNSKGLEILDQAKTFGAVSTAAFIAGGVLAVGGAVLWLTAPHVSKAGLRVTPGIGVGALSATIEGAW